jgi:peptidyl-prolyl cis-trans isomerase D
MMRQMREATKPIMLLAAIAFVALMVFEWGMDATGRSSGGLGEIGRVNGDPVMYDAYMAAYRQIYEQVQAQQEELIGTQQNKEIEDRAFDEIVTQILITQELDRRGIIVTNQEISEAAQFSPPDYLRPQFVDQSGSFNLAAYQSFLATLPPEQLLILEAYYRDVIPRSKLLRQVGAGIWLSDAELWQQWKDQNQLAEIRYVPLNPATRYPDAEFTDSRERDPRLLPDAPRTSSPSRPAPPYASPSSTRRRRRRTRRPRAPRRRRSGGRSSEGEDFAELARLESADQARRSHRGRPRRLSSRSQHRPLRLPCSRAPWASSPSRSARRSASTSST